MKKFLLILGFLILIPVVVLLIIAVPQILNKDPDATYELRGRYKTSDDGGTYLVVEDQGTDKCFVNSKPWPHNALQKGKISHGDVHIECGMYISITVPKGTIYYFNYWGP